MLTEHGNHRNKAPHGFHLHGYNFYQVGEKSEIYLNSVHQARKLDNEGRLLNRNIDNPVLKNSVSVPFAGLSVVRFLADNPGNCHHKLLTFPFITLELLFLRFRVLAFEERKDIRMVGRLIVDH